MGDELRDLSRVRSSSQALHDWLARSGWTDTDTRAPSALPGWSRGHVLTHLARNADGIAATVGGALQGEVVDRYPGGSRDADIEAGAARGVVELIADVTAAADRLDRVFAAAQAAGGWGLPSAESRVVSEWLPRRWREVEIHRVDLDAGYTAADWPAAFVSYLLPEAAEGVLSRTDEAVTITVDRAGSVDGALAGSSWTSGSGGVEVRGPDWALLAWLIGRSYPSELLAGAPELSRWL